jgi:hypothetical protein
MAFCLAIVVAVSPGCSVLKPSTEPVTIMATDPHAEIYVAGRPVGQGTATVDLPRDQDQTIMARTDDNRVGTATVTSHLGSGGIFDIIAGSFLIFPFFGLLAPGSRDLSASSVVIQVPPATGTASVEQLPTTGSHH